jgi:transporter family-2 protein
MYVFAPFVGALVTVMSGVNSRFAGIVGTLVATLVIHISGLAGVSAVLLFRREAARPGRVPAYYYIGGCIGVGTVFATIYSFGALGASLAVALALLGQTVCSVVVDATGFLGRTRYPLSPRRLPGIGLAILGVAIMGAEVVGRPAHAGAQAGAVAMVVAFISGVVPGVSFILNSELGRRKGLLRSTRVNYITGLATTLLLVAIVRPPVGEAARAVMAAGPVLALGGGLMGVAVVTSMNFVFPRMPAFSATLLLFSGQALAGVVIDAVAQGAFDVRKLVGTLVLLAGLAVNGLLTPRLAATANGAAGSAPSAILPGRDPTPDPPGSTPRDPPRG